MADQGFDASAYLAELEDQRKRLDIQIAGVRAWMGLGPSDNNGTPSGTPGFSPAAREQTVTGRVRSDEFFGMSIPAAIKRYLEIMKQPQAPAGITAALKAGGVLSESKNFYTTVWTAIKRLRDAGEIVNTQRGWGLSSWYPNRAKGGGDEKRVKGGKKRPKGRQRARKASKAAKVGTGQPSPYRAFLTQQMKAGKTMKETNEAWGKQKGES